MALHAGLSQALVVVVVDVLLLVVVLDDVVVVVDDVVVVLVVTSKQSGMHNMHLPPSDNSPSSFRMKSQKSASFSRNSISEEISSHNVIVAGFGTKAASSAAVMGDSHGGVVVVVVRQFMQQRPAVVIPQAFLQPAGV